MANREENLKKITDELEQLSDEELEKIAGGARILFRSSESNSSNRVLIMESVSNSSDRVLHRF